MPLLDPLSSVAESLRKEGIIPDIIPEDFKPSVLFSVAWGDKEVLLGNELSKDDTQSEPTIQITPMGGGEEANPSYTLVMLDPDAPSRVDPKFGPFRHWVLSGLRPPSEGEILVAASVQTDLLSQPLDPLAATTQRAAPTPYRPPGPGPETGKHRYVFLLFQEPAEGHTLPPDAPEFGSELEARRNWSPLDFAKRNNLTLVGANYFVLFSE